MPDLSCAKCGSTRDVANVSPDMDITPVPLCLLCRAEIAGLIEPRRRRG
jgi:hypothetical protein